MTVPAELLVKVLRAAVKAFSLGMLASAVVKAVSLGMLASDATMLLCSALVGKRKPTGNINNAISKCLPLTEMRARTGRTR